MAKYKFDVHYKGTALEDNSIPVKDLAPSLLSLSEAFQTIQKINNPSEAPLSLNITATKKGSFLVELLLVNGKDLLKQAMDFLNSSPSTAVINLTTYVGIFVNVVNYINKIANKKIKDKKEENGKVTITLDDDSSITMSADEFKVYKNVNFRKEIHEVVRPLESDGIDSIGFSHDKSISVTVDHTDYKKFEVPTVQEKQLDTNESAVFLQIINVAFEHGKWKFSMGDSTFFADITDEDFLKAVEKNEQQFGSTDTLKVKLKTEQYLDKNGKLKSDYTVTKVLDHIKGSEEIELDLFDDKDSD